MREAAVGSLWDLLHPPGLAQLGSGKRGFCRALVPCHCGCIWWHGVWVTGTEHVSGVALISPQQRGDGNPSETQSPASPGLGDVLWGRLFLAPCAARR